MSMPSVGLALGGRVSRLGRATLQVWAIARMTLLEASRRKVFAILLLFTAALLSSAAFFPSVNVAGRLRLTEVWSLRAASLFTSIVALFISGFSIPGDIEQKRMYMLVSKPVSKGTIFLGRFLGLGVLLVIFIASMGGVSVFFIRSVQFLAGSEFPALSAVPRRWATTFFQRQGAQLPGDEPKLYIEDQPGAMLVWEFDRIRRKDFPPVPKLMLKLGLSSTSDTFRASGNIRVALGSPAGGRHRMDVSLNTNEEREFSFPAELLPGEGPLRVEISCGDPDGRILGYSNSAVLLEKSMLFELSYARGMILPLLQALTVLSLTLMASTFLSAPVSIMLGILLTLVGTMHSYVREGTRDIDLAVEESDRTGHRFRAPEDLPEPVLKASSAISKAVLAVVPDFENFDFSRWLLKDRAVSWQELGHAVGVALPPVVVLVLAGTLILTFRDLG
jgi:hypothetical protein